MPGEMSCFLQAEKGAKFAVLIFKRDQLMYDIKNYAYIEGSVMPKETECHNRHMVQDVGEEGNEDRVGRVLDLCHAKAKELLYPYTKHEIHNSELNNILHKPKVYGIVMKVPGDFSQTTLILLERLIHEYFVCRVLQDWMSITNPGKADTWRLKAEEAIAEARSSLISRIGRVRRKLYPLG